MNEFNDNELIYLWRENFSKEAINILKNKHFEHLTKVLMKFFHSRSDKNIIEIDDISVLLNKWFIDVTLTYDYSQNKIKYIQYLIVQSKQLMNNLMKTLKSKKHYILNEYISYSNNNYLKDRLSSDLKMLSPEEYFNVKEDYEFKLDWIKEFLNGYDEQTKEIFWCCFYGDDRELLIKRLSLSKMEFNNKLFYLIKKMKNAYISYSNKDNC